MYLLLAFKKRPPVNRQEFTLITRKINGGLNGLEDRVSYYKVAKQVLGVTR